MRAKRAENFPPPPSAKSPISPTIPPTRRGKIMLQAMMTSAIAATPESGKRILERSRSIRFRTGGLFSVFFFSFMIFSD